MFLPKVEENKSIDQINHLLKEFEKQLNILPLENTHNSIMALGRIISEEMSQLLMKKEGKYDPKKLNTFHDNTETLYHNKILPLECYNFLKLIRRYGNETAQGIKVSSKLVLSFLDAFNQFIQWFDSYYFQNYQNTIDIESCCSLMDSIEYDEIKDSIVIEWEEENLKVNRSTVENFKTKKDLRKLNDEIKIRQNELKKEEELKKIKSKSLLNEKKLEKVNEKSNIEKHHIDKNIKLTNEIKILRHEIKEKEKTHQIQIIELLKKLDEKDRKFEICINLLNEINARGKRVENKIDELHSKIDLISNNISTVQSFCKRQLNNAQSQENIESIIAMFVDECVDNIMRHSQNFKENENYNIEKIKLIHSIGEDSWNKLCDKSKSFLITSRVMYDNLITMNNIVDYSGVCVLVTKALEVEVKKRFFTEFLEYLKNRYHDDYEKYHTALLYKYQQPLNSEKFTMGDIAFAMCYKKKWEDTSEQKANNKLRLMEYCRECVFSNYNDNEIKALLKRYASSLEDIRKDYRNPSAHTNEIKRIDAEECFNLVLDVEKLLKQMLDSFDT